MVRRIIFVFIALGLMAPTLTAPTACASTPMATHSHLAMSHDQPSPAHQPHMSHDCIGCIAPVDRDASAPAGTGSPAGKPPRVRPTDSQFDIAGNLAPEPPPPRSLT